MKIRLNYKASEQLRKDYLVQHGERLGNQFVEVEMTTLTPAQRATIVECGLQNDNAVNLPGIVTGVELAGYDAPKFSTKYEESIFDVVPTVEEWLTEADRRLRIRDRFQPELDAAIAEKKAAKETRDRRLAEVQAQYKALQDEWLPRIKTMSEAEANEPLPEVVRSVEAELKQLCGVCLWNEISAEKFSRWQSLRDERVKAEAHAAKSAWIEAHGSDHLKRAFAREHDCQRKYVIERAALEAPAFTVDFEDAAEWKDRSYPSIDALDHADEMEALKLGDVQIVWLTEPARDRKQSRDDYYDYEPFEPCEAIVIRNYLGKYDLVKSL